MVVLALVVFLLPSLIVAQQGTRAGEDETPLKISAEERAQAITSILKEFDERYVFPDVAAKVKATITSRMDEHKYDQIGTGQELATALTKDLQELTKDKHVRVNCSTAKLPARPANGDNGPPPEEMAKMRARQRVLNAGFVKVERLPGNLGYLRLDGFMDPEAGREPLLGAMTFLKNTDAFILDLRYNGGGTPLMIRDLCSYFFDEKPVHLNSMYFRKGDRKEEFWTNKDVPGPRYMNKDVYVLTSAFTFSGGEECAYNFQTQKRGTIIGETTGGGAHPGGTVPVADHYMIFIPTGRAINPITKTNWEGVGVKPDVSVDADKALETARELAVKKLLESSDATIRQRVQEDLQMQKRMAKRMEERRLATLNERQGKQ
jgi:C-terminal processing protease CtpA/Prc